MQTSKPTALKSPSIRRTVQTNIVQKPKTKIPPTNTTKIIAKPISPKITSDLKLQQQSTSTKTHIDNHPETLINVDNSKQSFASTVANSLIPKKDQAIVIDINVSLPHKDYIIAIGKLVQPSNILFASRISKERICIFLSSKALVDNLIKKHPYILIQEQQFKLRTLHNPDKRIILSNVYPNIPPDVIANELVKLNISLCSPITFLKAGIQVEDFTHILSFRRQTFIKHEDLTKIPSSILINYENTNYRIFISDDSLNCYICQAQGHTAFQCTNQNFSNSKIIKENNDIPNPNSSSALRIDDILNIDNTPTEVHPQTVPSRPQLEPLKILSEPPPQNNPPASTSTLTLLELQDLDSNTNTDIIEMEVEQPRGIKRSLPDSFHTQSAPSSPMDIVQETNGMCAPANFETPQSKTIKKKRIRKLNLHT